MSAESSRYAWTHKDSRTKPLHDATAQMAVDAQMQRRKQLTLQRRKTSKASNAKHPIFKNYVGLSTAKAPRCVGVLLLCMFTAYCNSQDLSCHISLPQFRWKLLLRLFLQSCRPYKDTAFRRENRLHDPCRISSLYCHYQARSNG